VNTLVIAEHSNNDLKPSNYHVVSAALELNDSYDILVFGSDCKEVANKASTLKGCNKVLLVDNELYKYQLPENSASLIKEIGKNYKFILGNSSTFGKNLLPCVAALLNVSQVSDVIEIKSDTRFKRPMYAGNIIATVESNESIKVLTIRQNAFEVVDAQSSCPVEELDIKIENNKSQFVSYDVVKTERPELTNAKIVVSGGRALKSGENFKLLIEVLADQLGAAVGSTRAAVDAGFVPNDYQVGQTGKIVAPDLYIAIGISGAIQHIAGIKDSKVIVAINSDMDAPIFKVADFGLVGDLFEIVPKFIKLLEKK